MYMDMKFYTIKACKNSLCYLKIKSYKNNKVVQKFKETATYKGSYLIGFHKSYKNYYNFIFDFSSSKWVCHYKNELLYFPRTPFLFRQD